LIDLTRRTGVSLLVAVVCHIVLLSTQANTASGVPVFQTLTFGAFAEVQRAVSGTVAAASGMWNAYVGLQAVRAENESLRRELDAVRLRWQMDRAGAQRVRGLEALLGLRSSAGLATISARIIAGDATPYFRTVTIDRGRSDGVRRDSAVLSAAGVVGRIVGEPGSRASRVQLLIDRNAAAGAIIERTRVDGLVTGDVDDQLLQMAYVSNLEDVEVGDTVVTSGVDGIYPKGFVIGDVALVRRGPGLYRTIHVRPRIRFGDLDEVLVTLPESPPPVSLAAGGGE
jgi:rod shape-determining protein MreC